MNSPYFGISPRRLRRGGIWLFQAAALALLLAMAIPARAANDRAVKSRVAPVYPEIAKRMKISGVVTVQATVDPEGKVTDAKAVSGNRALSPAAEEAVRKWRFAPADAQSTVMVEVTFALSQ
jgi:TonB family protein